METSSTAQTTASQPPLTLLIPGRRVDSDPADNTETLTIEKTYEIVAGTRGEALVATPVTLTEDQIVEFQFDDNTVWLGDFSTIDELFPGTSGKVRSAGTNSQAVVDIPVEMVVGNQNRSGILQKAALTLVKIFTKKAATDVLRDNIGETVRSLASTLEQKQLNQGISLTGGPDHEPGLYRLQTDGDGAFMLAPIPGPLADGHYLLFLHGTASSTLGSFGGLTGSDTWKTIGQKFSQDKEGLSTVLAFDHLTLTQSPLDNVRDLIERLPQKATLTLVSHSRGGLVGDTLNRFFSGDAAYTGFSAQEKDFLRKLGRNEDIDQIEQIETVARTKDITIEKFIRVACTASGTTLASHRLDVYFNVLFNLIGLATGGAANLAVGAFRDLLAELIKTKDDASVLPGLEVQSPQSPFNQLLNNAAPETIIQTPLIIIAGDAQLSLQWTAIKVALSNLFFLGDNDFVVDTRSMYNGAKRAANKVQYFFDQNAEVSHFSYFKNPRTQAMLRMALLAPAGTPIPGFTPLDSRAFTNEEIRNIDLSIPGGRVFMDSVSGQKPIVVLLPGIMGSTLTVKEDRVWINFFGFITGSLTKLEYTSENNLNVRADGLVGSSYRRLVEYLRRDYDVVTFPFDWRTKMADNADRLNQKLQDLLKFRQPIKLIGHSMGGVLIRDFILTYHETWTALNASRDFRLLFLGAPLGGSFRIPYVLFGLDSLISTLDHIDVTHRRADLIAVFSQFPGILSLLPLTTDTGNDFAEEATWSEMRKAFGNTNWPLPAKKLLDEFRTYRQAVNEGMKEIDYSRVTYIAGQARRDQQTISGYRIDQKGRQQVLQFLATKEGDESVTWASGIPPALTTANAVYFADVPHGELANEPSLFAAINDLIRTGVTTQLRQTKPTVRGGLETSFNAKTTFDFNLSPDGVEKTIMGLATTRQLTPSDLPIAVSVSNGDLKYARYPVVVGHFENDGILFAEKAIDWYLNGELSRRHRLGLYPGAFGTSETLVVSTETRIRGAVILGLGQQGQVTEFRLASSVEQGVAKYLAILNQRSGSQAGSTPLPKRIGISALLVGSGYGGLRIDSAVQAVIQGVQNANEKIRNTYTVPRTIDVIEFIELYKDRALTCIKAVSAIEQDKNRSLNIVRTGRGIKKLDGARGRLLVDDLTQWWTRITVQQRESASNSTEPNTPRSLQFSISTDAARQEEKSLWTLNDTLLGMLEDLSRNDRWSPELAKALFELMIPNDFKPQIKRQNNINWILDAYTAAFPWELLQDSAAGALPLSVNAGMIRQLKTDSFRININPVVEQTAIVVGDPDLQNSVQQLAAAKLEGAKIGEYLAVQGYEVSKLINASAAQILRTLFSKNYKIVHLAGHGVFHSDPKQPTGMLIGRDAYLTPAYIEQMGSVPELVFVNCCFLGQTDGAAESLSRSRFQLAANMGTQLINIGVKAVVVAGWAVDDNAALEFAECFYRYLFEGNNFGDAVRKARKAVYIRFGPRNNTWGAYQCYGDPFYRLLRSGESRQSVAAYNFVVPEEAEIELENLLGGVESGAADRENALNRLKAIMQANVRAGIGSVRITELLALLFSWLGEYEQAAEQFKQLCSTEKASFSFSTVEQAYNTQVRHQGVKGKKAKKALDNIVVTGAIDSINETIKNLETLANYGKTAERLSLIANAHKSLAIMQDGSDKQAEYIQASGLYQRAYSVACAGSGATQRYYPLINWVAIEHALVLAKHHTWTKSGPSSKRQLKEYLQTELSAVQNRDEDDKAYWDWIAEASLLLGQRLLGSKEIDYETILQQFANAWQRMGSEWLREAEVEHLEFLEDALSMSGESTEANDSRMIVGRLKTAFLVMP